MPTEHLAELDDQPVRWLQAPGEDGRPPVLYVHGVPTSADLWRPFLERTGGLAVDLPGFGRSGKRGDLDYSISGYGDFAGRFLDRLGIGRVRLVVHGWGAAVLSWAQREPERVERLVILDGVPLLPGFAWSGIARAWRAPFAGELAMGFAIRPVLRRALPAPVADIAWAGWDQGTQRAILRLHRASDPSVLAGAGIGLGAVDAPALVLWGEDDAHVPARFAAAYAAALGAARAEVVAGAGHWPWLDRPEVIGRVAEFLAAPPG